jgi:hypothetical protein
MRLRSTTLISAVEECEELVCTGLFRGSFPLAQHGIRDSNVIFFEPCRLFLFFLGRKNEMFRNDWELVQD